MDSFAVFGAPVVHEDDARRAVVAALRLARSIPQLVPPGTLDDERLSVKIGIDTGRLVISRIEEPHVEYLAVGETMRTADLLQQYAEPGAILISEASRSAVERHFRTEPATDVPGLRAYRVVGVAPSEEIARPQRTLAPFIGRERELGLLEALLDQAVAGKGQVLSIVGEPGMGKSRLVHEFTIRVCGRRASPSVLEARADHRWWGG